MSMCPNSNRVRRKGKKGKGAMSLTLRYTSHYAFGAWSLVTSTLAAVEPPAMARHLNPGGGGTSHESSWYHIYIKALTLWAGRQLTLLNQVFFYLHEIERAPLGGLRACRPQFSVPNVMIAQAPISSYSLIQASQNAIISSTPMRGRKAVSRLSVWEIGKLRHENHEIIFLYMLSVWPIILGYTVLPVGACLCSYRPEKRSSPSILQSYNLLLGIHPSLAGTAWWGREMYIDASHSFGKVFLDQNPKETKWQQSQTAVI